MSSTTTVAQFAAELHKSTATLIEQLTSAGVAKVNAEDALSESDKQKLLAYLQASHGTVSTERKKITLVKKSTSEIKQADATGKARTIQVEVRKKRTFIKREDGADAPADEAPVEATAAQPVMDEADLARREDEALRHAELLRRQEADLDEKRRLREVQDAKTEEEERAAAEKIAQAVARAAEVFEKAKPAGKKAKQAAIDADASAPKVSDEVAAEQAAKATELALAQAAAKAKATAEFQADAAKSIELQDRRKKAEAEAAGIRAMMNAPKRVLVPHVDPKAVIKGTLHKPAAGSVAAKAAPGAAGKKEIGRAHV